VLFLSSLLLSLCSCGWAWFDEAIGNSLGDVVKDVAGEIAKGVDENVVEKAKEIVEHAAVRDDVEDS